ncbi:hypothetical protein CDL15_Pgr023466 [Punica granatum]|uniref:Uncharacterized protein n=1 Tax=Punica granatum TaxID=22663 RepID=A0A218W8I3_PUNGR|nr:hypothetical protein CDL15_Pgr023466 [Punica granatum]PKI68483.1 hypothetical protein CRG98_011121 [Punica granatum]
MLDGDASVYVGIADDKCLVRSLSPTVSCDSIGEQLLEICVLEANVNPGARCRSMAIGSFRGGQGSIFPATPLNLEGDDCVDAEMPSGSLSCLRLWLRRGYLIVGHFPR